MIKSLFSQNLLDVWLCSVRDFEEMMVGLCNLTHDGKNFVLLERFDVFGVMVKIWDALLSFQYNLLYVFVSTQVSIYDCSEVSSVLQPLATRIIALQPMMFRSSQPMRFLSSL